MTWFRKLRLNGNNVMAIGNQYLELDPAFAEPTKAEDEPLLTEAEFRSSRKRPECDCGAKHVGIQPYMQGHSEWCSVSDEKTPVIW